MSSNGDGLPPGYPVRDRITINGADLTAGQIEWQFREWSGQCASAEAERSAALHALKVSEEKCRRLQTAINMCGLIPGAPV